jgi:SAM-dependent methyltransferase
MSFVRSARYTLVALLVTLCGAGVASAQPPDEFKPTPGQAGKDVVWVPTPQALVEKMLDMANVTSQDLVMDLGSGDGRNIIAAAKRGARAVGVEYNPKMVELSRKIAEKEGVGGKATFIEGDMYEADISKASVMALFLLTHNMEKLRPKFMDLKPGSRIVANTFGFDSWTPDKSETITEDCQSWCTALLWIVPAKVEGTWRLPNGELTLKQEFQMISGTFGKDSVTGRLTGDQIVFTAGGTEYTGRVTGDSMKGITRSGASNGNWSATRKAGSEF